MSFQRASRAAGRARGVDLALPPPPDPDLDEGENLLVNSKFADGADGWSQRFSGEGTATLSASATADHQQVRFAGSSGNRSAYQQDVAVTMGQRYTASAYVNAIDAATDPDSVILNHTPFSGATLISARPTLGDAAVGRVHYVFEATESGNLTLVAGLTGSGDITMERPQLDPSPNLRGYVATDPAEAPPPPPDGDVDLFTLAYDGHAEGGRIVPGRGNNIHRLTNGVVRGWALTITKAGTIDECQFNISSNRLGERSKSEWQGNRNYAINGYPSPAPNWQLRLRIYNMNASYQAVGSPLITRTWKYTNPNGSSGASSSNNSRVLFPHTGLGLNVAVGDRLGFFIDNLTTNPTANHPCLNMTLNTDMPTNNPPRRASIILYGNDLCSVTPAGSFANRVGGLGLRYTSGTGGFEFGEIDFDATGSALARFVGGSNRLRQQWTSTLYRRVSAIALAIKDLGAGTAGPVTVVLTGAGISAQTISIPNSSIPAALEMLIVPLPSSVILHPGAAQLEVRAPTAGANRYEMCGRRHWNLGLANSSNSTIVPAGGVVPITRNRGSGTCQLSSNGGSNWSNIVPNADLPLVVMTDQKYSTTLEGVPA